MGATAIPASGRGELALGSLAGIAMNTAIVLPAILLGRAIDTARAFGDGSATEGTPAELLREGGRFAALVELEAAGWQTET